MGNPEKQNRTGNSPAGKNDVKARIIEVAERMFARQGLEGVSLRAIAREGGFRNNVVVQYHFGDKAGLVRAIFQHRLPGLDRRRAQLLEEARASNRMEDPGALVEVLFRPIAELLDADGMHSYAAFLFNLQQFDPLGKIRQEAREFAPLTHHVSISLRHLLSDLSDRFYDVRLQSSFAAFFTVLMYMDAGAKHRLISRADRNLLVTDAIEMATAAMCKSPPTESRPG